MDEDQRERLLLTQRVMRAMRHQSARIPLADYNAEGGRQVVVCLGADTLEYVTNRVDAVGGTATVVIPRADGLVPLGWTHAPGVATDSASPPLHPASTVEMLLDYFVASGAHQIQFQVAPAHGGVDVTEHEPIKVPV